MLPSVKTLRSKWFPQRSSVATQVAILGQILGVCVFALVKISISTVWNLAALFELTFGVSTSQEQLLLSHHTTPQAKNGFEKYYLNASR